MGTLSRRERGIVGAGAVAALVVVGYLLVVEPLLARGRDAEALVPARRPRSSGAGCWSPSDRASRRSWPP